jgi:hypothetical protein
MFLRTFWFLLLSCTIYLFWKLVPLSIYEKYPIDSSLVGGIISGFFFVMWVGGFQSIFDWFGRNDSETPSKLTRIIRLMSFLLAVPFIALATYFFYQSFFERRHQALASEGIMTTASVVDKSYYVLKGLFDVKKVVHQVHVNYRVGKKIYSTQIQVSEAQFDELELAQRMALLYWERDANIYVPIFSSADFKAHTSSSAVSSNYKLIGHWESLHNSTSPNQMLKSMEMIDNQDEQALVNTNDFQVGKQNTEAIFTNQNRYLMSYDGWVDFGDYRVHPYDSSTIILKSKLRYVSDTLHCEFGNNSLKIVGRKGNIEYKKATQAKPH